MANTTYSLDQYRTDAEKQLKQKQQSAKQAADVNYQKLMKYLPQQTAGQSIGMTETAKIAANNAYQRALAQADSDYTGGMTDLLNNYRLEKQAEEDQLKAEQDAFYNELMTTIEAGEFNTTADLKKYISSAEGKVSDAQMAALNRKLEYYKGKPEQIAADAEIKNSKVAAQSGVTVTDAVFDKNNGFLGWGRTTNQGDNFRVKLGEETYDVQYGVDPEPSKAGGIVKAAKRADVKTNSIFAYEGDLYYLDDKGQLHSIEARSDSHAGYGNLKAAVGI